MPLQCPNCSHSVRDGARFCQQCGGSIDQPQPHVPIRVGMPGRSLLRALLGGALILLIGVGVFTGGCNKGSSSFPHEVEAHLQAETIPGYGPMPAWLKSGSDLVKREYIWAALHIDELQYIPCYCGCGPESVFGHMDNAMCYFDLDAGNKITGLDNHGFG